MPRIVLYTLVLGIFLIFSRAEAANTINWTFYAPGAKGKMQGSMSSAYPNLEGSSVIRTLDDVRTNKSKYVTLASATSMKGRYFCIGTVTYTSPSGNGGDGKTHTIENVVGYVHDTGCAFNGNCSCGWLAQYCDGRSRPDKMDIAVGNFTGYEALTAANYVSKNPNVAPKNWTQIAGLPTQSQSQNPLNACGGEVRETGTPQSAPYTPSLTTSPNNPLTAPVTQPYTTTPQPQPSSVPTSQPLYSSQSQPLPNGYTGAPVSYPIDQTVSYPLAVIPVAPAIPTTATNSIFSVLFQQSSATSGIRTLQTVAQSVLNLFTVPASTTPLPTASTYVSETDDSSISTENVSLMTVSQFDDERSEEATTSIVVAPSPERQLSTFTDVRVDPAPNAAPVESQSLVVAILSAFKSVLQGILRLLTRQ